MAHLISGNFHNSQFEAFGDIINALKCVHIKRREGKKTDERYQSLEIIALTQSQD